MSYRAVDKRRRGEQRAERACYVNQLTKSSVSRDRNSTGLATARSTIQPPELRVGAERRRSGESRYAARSVCVQRNATRRPRPIGSLLSVHINTARRHDDDSVTSVAADVYTYTRYAIQFHVARCRRYYPPPSFTSATPHLTTLTCHGEGSHPPTRPVSSTGFVSRRHASTKTAALRAATSPPRTTTRTAETARGARRDIYLSTSRRPRPTLRASRSSSSPTVLHTTGATQTVSMPFTVAACDRPHCENDIVNVRNVKSSSSCLQQNRLHSLTLLPFLCRAVCYDPWAHFMHAMSRTSETVKVLKINKF